MPLSLEVDQNMDNAILMQPRSRDEAQAGTKRKRRTSLACDTCRKQKEKCEGGPPCWRCQRLNRPCHFQAHPIPRKAPFVAARRPSRSASEDYDRRVQNLERIVRHFLGDVPLDDENVERLAAKCTARNNEVETSLDVNESFDVHFVSRNVAFYSGEFSHWNFSEKLRRSTRCQQSRLNLEVKEYWRPTHLLSSNRAVTEAMAQLPPQPIAEFLIDIFFKYAEVNSFYMERKWIQEKVQICYDPASNYTASDIPWVCSFFAVLAIGFQMAHMEDDHSNPESAGTEEINVCTEASLGLAFYHVACKLVPDVILTASYESVQAFLLLATWALPISTGGLSYTYLGLAMKMAIQNGMHRKYVGSDCDSRTIELRNRLFWTTYTLERRTSIMHGRPSSIVRSEVNADMPTDHPSFDSPNFANMMAFIDLVSWMGEAAETLAQFRICPKRLLSEYSDRLFQLKTSIKQWWNSLSTDVECRDPNPRGPLFRQNLHLRLYYLLLYIYMGRPFIFHIENERASSPTAKSRRSELVDDCVQSALDILATLQSLADNIGLCRASYTEFSSCRAALLVILAESLHSGKSRRLQEGLKRGMILIRQMTGGTASESEISYIESIEAAIRQLSSRDEDPSTTEMEKSSSASAYAKFKDWTQSMKDKSTGNTAELSSFSPLSHLTAGFDGAFADLLQPQWSSCDLDDLDLDPDVFLATSD